jgi:hypothetical protein
MRALVASSVSQSDAARQLGLSFAQSSGGYEQARSRNERRACFLTLSTSMLLISDAPTLGLLLCENRGEPIIAEYALRDIAKPIGVSAYRVTRQLPEPLRDGVPSIEDLKHVVEKLRPEMGELQAERYSDQSSLHKPPTRSVRRK